MSLVNDGNPTHVIDLLGMALQTFKSRLEAETAHVKPPLRGSQLRLLAMTPVAGVRPTALAGLVGMTKQSLGEFVTALERAGYLQVDVDPSDRRARIVSPTAKGRKLQSRINDIIAEVETEWEAQVGPKRWATFRAVLTSLTSAA